jgi:DNA-binding CsgD family transcriptional regulator
MNTKLKLQKELRDLIRNEDRNGDLFDMTPLMREIYHWGYRNISNKELKRIIKLYKKT